jgi:probable phosphoglycerate mutase
MKTYIALVRHGVTDWNYDARAQGQSDIPLNAEGRRQAEAVAARLSSERWDAIYSSDLARARSTAEAICRLTGHALVTDPRLRERNMGIAEGTTETERQLRWPGVPFYSIAGVESDEALTRRGVEIITEIARRHPGQRVIVVAHGGIIVNFIRGISGGAVHVGISRNTGISPVIFDGERFEVAGPHDYRHLLIDGIEYTGEKYRLFAELRRSGLPDLNLQPSEIEPFIMNASAVESAWVDGRLVGYVRAFTDRIRSGYVDVLDTLPEFHRIRPVLVQRLEQRFPGVRFDLLTNSLEQRSGA